MADYHPLIARAVSGLEKNTGENRRALYERARVALVAQLRGVVPALEESEITRERLSLEEAIRKVAAEAARHAREAARANPVKRTEQPRRELPPPARASARTTGTASTSRSAGSQTAPAPDNEAPPPRPASAIRRSLEDEALKGYRESSTARPEPRRPRSPDPDEQQQEDQPRSFPLPPILPRPPAPERHPLEEFGQLEPQVQPENLWALPLDAPRTVPPVDLDARHPPPPQHQAPRYEPEPTLPRRAPRSYARMIVTGLVLTLLLGIGTVVWWQWPTIAGIASGVSALLHTPAAAPPKEAASPQLPKKNTERIGQPQPSTGPAVAQRVVLYEEEPDDPQGKRYVGTVLWRTEMRPPTPGRAPELAVRADIDVPERNMKVTLSFRRNTDASLPASHTIEIVFTLPADTPSGGVQKVPGVLMKQAEQTRGVPLAGLAVPVTPGYFLIGLSSLESDMQRNLQLLKERAWFDIPIIYNNNRRAILAMEKGTPGEQAFTQAFAAWQQ
jgi:hypothetical protein